MSVNYDLLEGHTSKSIWTTPTVLDGLFFKEDLKLVGVVA